MINPEPLSLSPSGGSFRQQPGVASTVSSATKASLNPNMCSWRVNSESAGLALQGLFLLTLKFAIPTSPRDVVHRQTLNCRNLV
jgi:hypothetical protein